MALNGSAIKDKYKDLLSIDNSNTGITGLTGALSKYIDDGDGGSYALSIGQDRIGIGTETPNSSLQIVDSDPQIYLDGTHDQKLVLNTTAVNYNTNRLEFHVGGVKKSEIAFIRDSDSYLYMQGPGGSTNFYNSQANISIGALPACTNGINNMDLGSTLTVRSLNNADTQDKRANPVNYQLHVEHGSYATGKTAGICFSATDYQASADDKVGASIVYSSVGAYGQGNLTFYVKNVDTANPPNRILEFEGATGRTVLCQAGLAGASTGTLTIRTTATDGSGGLHIIGASSVGPRLTSDGVDSHLTNPTGSGELHINTNNQTNQLNLLSSGNIAMGGATSSSQLKIYGTLEFDTGYGWKIGPGTHDSWLCDGPSLKYKVQNSTYQIDLFNDAATTSTNLETESTSVARNIFEDIHMKDVNNKAPSYDKNIYFDHGDGGGWSKKYRWNFDRVSDADDRVVKEWVGDVANPAIVYGRASFMLNAQNDSHAGETFILPQDSTRMGFFTCKGGYHAQQLSVAPGTKVNFGCIWMKDDNTLHWVDPDGVDHTITIS